MAEMEEWLRQEIISLLRYLSDTEFQERVWLRGEGPEVSSLDELVIQLFGDTGLGDLLDKSEGNIFSWEADATLKVMRVYIQEIDQSRDIAEVLQDPKWAEVRELATKAADLIDLQ